jgi:hypothetical protein
MAWLDVLISWLPISWRPRKILELRERASQWRRVREKHLEKEPACVACGRKENVIVHHILPVSIAPELELAENNLVTLCAAPCHIVFGHFFSYHCYNRDVRKMAQQYYVKLMQRKCQKYR